MGFLNLFPTYLFIIFTNHAYKKVSNVENDCHITTVISVFQSFFYYSLLRQIIIFFIYDLTVPMFVSLPQILHSVIPNFFKCKVILS